MMKLTTTFGMIVHHSPAGCVYVCVCGKRAEHEIAFECTQMSSCASCVHALSYTFVCVCVCVIAVRVCKLHCGSCIQCKQHFYDTHKRQLSEGTFGFFHLVLLLLLPMVIMQSDRIAVININVTLAKRNWKIFPRTFRSK